MFKIGDFSRFSRVSVKTLRYYDEVGLLKPAKVDRFTGYRYYSAEQLPRLNRILALKDLGLPLEEVSPYVSIKAFKLKMALSAILYPSTRFTRPRGKWMQHFTHTCNIPLAHIDNRVGRQNDTILQPLSP